MSQYVSPHQNKFSRISQKLTIFQNNLVKTKTGTMSSLDLKMKTFQDRMGETMVSFNKALNSITSDLNEFQKVFQEDKRNFDSNLENGIKEMINLETKMSTKFEQETLARKDGEAKLTKIVEDNFNLMRSDLSKETKLRVEIMENLNQALENDIPKLYESIKSGSSLREESDTNILKKVLDEINKMMENVQDQKKTREESEAAIYEMLRDLVTRVKSEIEAEKKDRESSEENLLNLIEELCNKLSAIQ